MRFRVAIRAVLLLLPCSAPLARAARPELDVSFGRPAVHADLRARLHADASAGRVGEFSFDERYGVPNFLWAGRLAAPPTVARATGRAGTIEAARAHLTRLAGYYRLDAGDVSEAQVHEVHDTGQGGIIVRFEREVDGIPVFRDQMNVMMDRSLGLVAVSGYLPGKLDAGPPEARIFRRDALESVGRALDDFAGSAVDRSVLGAAQSAEGGYETFALAGSAPAGLAGGTPIRERKVLFHLPDRLEPAYYVEVIADTQAVAYVVSANDGSLLFRHNLMANDAFSYRVWADATTIKAPLDGPQGNSNTPHPTGVPNNLNPPVLAPTLTTLQNGPISTNDPWLPPGATVTNGNNVDAYVDLSAPDGLSAGDFRASTTSANTFDRTYNTNLAPGSSNTQQQAAITQLFYDDNFFHDWYYDAGFNEASGNAQTSNYGRGGLENDNLHAEAQDYSGTNNANMTTPADGSHPKMQMYVFNNNGVQVQLNSPGSIAGNRIASGASWGPAIFNLTGNVVLANDGTAAPTDGCQPITNNLSGKIALIDRGTCTFVSKIQNAQNAGAVGVIIVNNSAPGVITMGCTAGCTTTIPAVMVSLSDGIDIKDALLSGPVSATLLAQAGLSRDGTIDNQIVAHEWGHYISNRLIGNASGLTNNQGQGMGEGWGDFHAMLLTVKPEDASAPAGANFAGTYALASYALSNSAIPDNAYYFGIRRYPYSTDMTKNPLTFQHIQNGTALPVGPPVAFGADGSNNAEVHNTGEVWCAMLWECYASLLRDTGRLTFDQARDRMRNYLVAGYKLTPNAPTFLNARDAILAAAQAGDPTDYTLFCAAFAKRGAGQGAVAPPSGSTDNVGVTESYTICGGDLKLSSATLDDAVRSCDADGVLDEGEAGHFTVTLQNTGTTSLSATSATLSSTNPSVVFIGGSLLTFPPSSPNGTPSAVTTVRSSGASGIQTQDIQVQFNDPGLAFAGPRIANFLARGNTDLQSSTTESVEAPSPPWTFTGPVTAAQQPWRVQTLSAQDHRFFAPGASGISDQSLVSPPLQVGSSPLSFTFQQAYAFEASSSNNRDGGVLELSTDGGANWTDLGGQVTPTYGGTITTVSGNPLAGRSAFVGQSPGYPALSSATVNLGTTYAGQTIQIRFRAGCDQATGAAGWSIDNLAFSGLTNAPFMDVIADPGPCAPTAVDSDTPASLSFAVAGPNPAVGGARFRFALPRASHVRITVHDIAGRRVATLADGDYAAGVHAAEWQPNRGGAPRSGVYFARMTVAGQALERRLVLLSR
jgi:hypothetical protein